MKTVYVGYRSSEGITITDEAYEQIERIIRASAICQECGQPYGEATPQVALNQCLTCFLDQHHDLTFVEIHENRTSYSSYEYARFIDQQGYMYESSITSSHRDVRKDERATLLYWGFIIPTSFTYLGKEIEIKHYESWNIYGDVKSDVVIVQYYERYGDGKSYAFLLYKDNTAVLLDKRKGNIRKLFASATARVEATKDARGYYHPKDGREATWISDYTLYREIASMEKERHK